MYAYTAAEAAAALRGSKNPNAALKNFLKHEVQGNEVLARFVKNLRTTIDSKSPQACEALFEQGIRKFDIAVLAILRCAYADTLVAIVEPVIEKYADDFNKTYEHADSAINVKDEANFKRIVEEVLALFDQGLSAANLNPAGLMKEVLIHHLFEAEVVKEINARLGGSVS